MYFPLWRERVRVRGEGDPCKIPSLGEGGKEEAKNLDA